MALRLARWLGLSLACLSVLADATQLRFRSAEHGVPTQQVTAQVVDDSGSAIQSYSDSGSADSLVGTGGEVTDSTAASMVLAPLENGVGRKYLIGSFPDLRQVAYVALPDNVWRPLVTGKLTRPGAVAVDAQSSALYVADPSNAVVWLYKLQGSSGFLDVLGERRAAVEGFAAQWMDVNIMGDLFFSGRDVSGSTNYDSIYKMAAADIAAGNTRAPTQVYSRTNTGGASALAWSPSGVAVDSFFVYWCNQDGGTQHGTVVKASIDSVGSTSEDTPYAAVNSALDKANGLAATGTHLFWASPSGVYGAAKSSNTGEQNASLGLISTQPGGGATWDPQGIRWDGDNTIYLADSAAGVIYALPALNNRPHNLTKFTDAPGILDLAVVGFENSGAHAYGLWALLPAAFALLATLWH